MQVNLPGDASSLELNLRIVGVTMILLSGLHATFSRQFGWKEELPKLTLLNRQVFVVHVFFIALALFMQGVGCIFFADVLCQKSRLSAAVSAGMCIYWLARLICQHFVYDKKLWQGKPFETAIHVIFSLNWLYYVLVFGWLFLFQQVV